MSSQSRPREREETRRVNVRTLVIASLASFVAAVVTSQFSTVGTPIAAAITPVIVALVSELLHRPTEALVQRVTTSRTAVLPDAAGAGPPAPPEADPLPERAPAEPVIEPPPRRQGPEPMTVHRPRRSRRKIAVGAVAVTAALAFVVAAAAFTLPELIAGQSIGHRDNKTTFFGGKPKKEKKGSAPAAPSTAPPARTAPTPAPAPERTTTTPAETEAAPPTTSTERQP